MRITNRIKQFVYKSSIDITYAISLTFKIENISINLQFFSTY